MAIKVRRALARMQPHLIDAKRNNLNEADTVLRVIKFFEEVLGYDPLREISREAMMKKQYVDILLKPEGVPRIIVEVKAAGMKLRDRHIDQATAYAAKNNYPWVLLTNGVAWILYHVEFDEGIDFERVFDVDLSDESRLDQSAELLSNIHRDSVRRGGLERYWEKTTALSPASIARALFTEDVLLRIRREVRRQEGVLLDTEDIAAAFRQLLTPETWEGLGRIKIRKRRANPRRAKKRAGKVTLAVPVPVSPPPAPEK